MDQKCSQCGLTLRLATHLTTTKMATTATKTFRIEKLPWMGGYSNVERIEKLHKARNKRNNILRKMFKECGITSFRVDDSLISRTSVEISDGTIIMSIAIKGGDSMTILQDSYYGQRIKVQIMHNTDLDYNKYVEKISQLITIARENAENELVKDNALQRNEKFNINFDKQLKSHFSKNHKKFEVISYTDENGFEVLVEEKKDGEAFKLYIDTETEDTTEGFRFSIDDYELYQPFNYEQQFINAKLMQDFYTKKIKDINRRIKKYTNMAEEIKEIYLRLKK